MLNVQLCVKHLTHVLLSPFFNDNIPAFHERTLLPSYERHLQRQSQSYLQASSLSNEAFDGATSHLQVARKYFKTLKKEPTAIDPSPAHKKHNGKASTPPADSELRLCF